MTHRLPNIETPRLLLRGLQKGDEDFLIQLDTDPLVMRYIHRGPLSGGQAANWARLQVDADTSPRAWKVVGKWIVELQASGTRIGWVDVSKLSLSGEDFRSVGYEFAPAFWGRGYAVEAVAAVVCDLFVRLEEPGVVAFSRPDNERSIRLLRKIGFRRLGKQVKDDGSRSCDVFKISRRAWKTREARTAQFPPRGPDS